jgi:NAD(P)-dependent dehydrogenase (short-subunit alcohol dehydrogenase family)
MSLVDKVVLVTGAARGMGREYVRGFRKAGARVIATDLAWEPTGASSDHERFLEEVETVPTSSPSAWISRSTRT